MALQRKQSVATVRLQEVWGGRLAQPLVDELNAKGPWACITVVYGSMLTSLEVFAAGKDAVANRPDDSNLVALAWVLTPDLEGYNLLYRRYEAMYAGLLETKVCDSLSAARDWIERVLASESKGTVA